MKFLVVAACLLATTAFAVVPTHYVVKGSDGLKLVDSEVQDFVARGVFEDTLLTTGWGVFNVETSKAYSLEEQYYAAGLIEGFTTAQRIYEHFVNMNHEFSGAQEEPAIKDYFARQLAWTDKQVMRKSAESAFWKQIGAIQQQFYGLVDGYKLAMKSDKSKQLSLLDMQFLNAVGDMLDLATALVPSKRVDWDSMSAAEVENLVLSRGRCSAFVRVSPDYSELFAAQSAWFTYQAMNRIYKHYKFGDFTESFSSYPGFLSSLDDFYMMSSGLTMVQTTNNIFNLDLYKKVHPYALLAWQRVRLANEVSKNGQEWYENVKQYNSGTYNNQYMVVDYNLFTPGKELPNGLLWVVEQIPGLVVGADRTADIRRSHWPSYNVPFFEEIYNQSGYPAMVSKFVSVLLLLQV
jgi:hypothetical protein